MSLLYIDGGVLLLYTHYMKNLPVHYWNWPSAILLLLMLQVAATRLVITDWTDFLIFAETMAALGVILGLALGFSHFQKRAVRLLTLGYSLILIPWQLTLVIEDELLSARLASVGGRLYFALIQFFQREPVQDGLLFVTFISTLIWFLSIVSGYYWARHQNYLAAVLPGGIFTLVIHLYDQYFTRRIWLLAAYLLFALLLLGYQYYLRNRESWRERRVFLMQESSFDLTRGMIIAASLFIFVAWTVPASQAGLDAASRAWRQITRPWQDVQEWFSNAVESLQGTVVSKPIDFYGSQLSLGTGSPLSEDLLFIVEVPEAAEKGPRYYWRGYVYDVYQGSTWYAAGGVSEEYSPSGDELLIPNSDERVNGRFIFKTQAQEALLYTTSEPVWVSRPGRIQAVTTVFGEKDLLAWAAEPKLLAGEQYEVIASLANPSIQQLQNAGTGYPEWVTDRYLQLPEDFSPRISELVDQITQNSDTPYDKAAAITRYLRSEIEYANPLPKSPPESVDPIEWILFDLKQGFCNYYAAAEVLMLRSIDIPARMAVGFTEGNFDEETNEYLVHTYNAHAWPEVYFPGIGWVEFEPTGNQDPLARPNRPEDDPTQDEGLAGGPLVNPDLRAEDSTLNRLDEQLGREVELGASQTGIIDPRPFYLALAVILLGGFWYINKRFTFIDRVPVYLLAAYERNGGRAPAWIADWARWAMLAPIERYFETINRSLRLLGTPPAFYATPAERAEALLKKLPVAINSIETLLDQHQSSLFTPDPGEPGLARRASLEIWYYTAQSIIRRFLYGPPIE